MKKTHHSKTVSKQRNPISFSSKCQTATDIASPTPYVKFLPEITSELHQSFLQASGQIDYQASNNYVFQALLQESEETLINLICSILHWSHKNIKSIEIVNPILLGKYIDTKTFILDMRVYLNDNTILNLEMQLTNEGNWPELHATYKMQNIKNRSIYTDKFILHVV